MGGAGAQAVFIAEEVAMKADRAYEERCCSLSPSAACSYIPRIIFYFYLKKEAGM
jgi:hypothetical protein